MSLKNADFVALFYRRRMAWIRLISYKTILIIDKFLIQPIGSHGFRHWYCATSTWICCKKREKYVISSSSKQYWAWCEKTRDGALELSWTPKSMDLLEYYIHIRLKCFRLMFWFSNCIDSLYLLSTEVESKGDCCANPESPESVMFGKDDARVICKAEKIGPNIFKTAEPSKNRRLKSHDEK